LEELVDDALGAETLDGDVCRDSARRLDVVTINLRSLRNRLANASRERARLAKLTEIENLEFRRVPGWAAYDVDRDGEYVRSYYGLDRDVVSHPCRVLSAPPDPETGLPTVTLYRNRGEDRRIAVAALARETWVTPGSGRDAGGYDYSTLLTYLGIRS
jgi:hypothetical protein